MNHANLDAVMRLWHGQPMPKRSSKPDLNQLAFRIAQQAAEAAPGQPTPTPDEIKRVMQALGRIGGQKGGRIRANNLSGKRKREIAKKAAQARWGKKTSRNK